jgi:hypothetical protein
MVNALPLPGAWTTEILTMAPLGTSWKYASGTLQLTRLFWALVSLVVTFLGTGTLVEPVVLVSCQVNWQLQSSGEGASLQYSLMLWLIPVMSKKTSACDAVDPLALEIWTVPILKLTAALDMALELPVPEEFELLSTPWNSDRLELVHPANEAIRAASMRATGKSLILE